MINEEDETVAVLRRTCTVEEAAAMLLGWLRGSIFPKNISLVGAGVMEMPSQMASLTKSLTEHLQDEKEGARLELIDAASAEADSDRLMELLGIVQQKNEQIQLAHKYLIEITDELAKDGNSELRIDRFQTEQTKVQHITTASLDQWGIKRYGISILGNSVPELAVKPPVEVLEEVTPKGGLSRTKAEGLCTSFALLVLAFSKSAPKYRKADAEPNISAIASHIADQAIAAGGGEEIGGQSIESIKDRIEEALKTLRSKQPK